MSRIAALLAVLAASVLCLEAAYRSAWRRGLNRIEVDLALAHPGETVRRGVPSRFGTDASGGVSALEDAWEALKDRLGLPCRLHAPDGLRHAYAYFLANFDLEPLDPEGRAGVAGYLWSPRTWTFHRWPD